MTIGSRRIRREFSSLSPTWAVSDLVFLDHTEEFYRFLVEELRPMIAATYHVDPHDQTLYGHSIAGMFTLNVLLDHPKSFRNFVASSPALWWNKRSLLKNVPQFARKMKNEEAAPRVLITVGSTEQDVPNPLPPQMTDAIRTKFPMVPSFIGTLIAKVAIKKLDWRMVDNARKLATQLKRIGGRFGYLVRFHAFEGEDHLTALPASIGHALAFALRSSRS